MQRWSVRTSRISEIWTVSALSAILQDNFLVYVWCKWHILAIFWTDMTWFFPYFELLKVCFFVSDSWLKLYGSYTLYSFLLHGGVWTIYILICVALGPGRSVGIATDYGPEGPGSNPSPLAVCTLCTRISPQASYTRNDDSTCITEKQWK